MKTGQMGDPPDRILQKMTEILVSAGIRLQQSLQEGDIEGCNKNVFIANAKALIDSSDLPEEIKQWLSADADDWNYDETMKIPVFPKITASFILQLRDASGNLQAVVIMTVRGFSRVIAANKKGVWVYEKEQFHKVKRISKKLCGKNIPSELRVFAQKITRHWRIMGEAIPDIIGQGISTINSMGPYWLTREYFDNFDIETGTITVSKTGLCEPYVTKQKEEVIPTVIWWLNCSVPKEDRMVITNLSGEEIFQDMNIVKGEPATCEKYCGPGWIVAPTPECWAVILYAFCNALALSIPEKVRALAKNLESVKDMVASKLQEYRQ